jgi:hypothetical protein
LTNELCAQDAPPVKSPKAFKSARRYAEQLGVSYTTLWRISKSDPRFPNLIKVRGRTMVEVSEGDRFAEALYNDSVGGSER